MCQEQLQFWTALAQLAAAIVSTLSVIVAGGVAVWGINAWRREYIGKRRIKFAEKTLEAFYAVKDSIKFIRNWCLTDSINDEQDNVASEEGKRQTYRVIFQERYRQEKPTFNRFQVLKHRFMATFESDAESIFTEIENICWKMQDAARDADMREVHRMRESDMAKRQELTSKIDEAKDVFMERRGRENAIGEKLNRIGVQLEEILKPTITAKR